MTGLYAIKPRFQRSLVRVEHFLVRRRVHPDALTHAALSLMGGLALGAESGDEGTGDPRDPAGDSWGRPVDPSNKTDLSLQEHWEVTRWWEGVIRSPKQEAQR
ncbi:MAG: hypothetical protein HY329_19405 [Chloroflexi bacterium]|nr:hypothetical protein [Chloroflexota bacterium]